MSMLCMLSYLPLTSNADSVVDKVYKPNILPFQRDIEWRLVSRESEQGNQLLQRFAFGHALSEKFMLEVFLLAQRNENDDFEIAAYELEGRWMLGEQGQYWSDTAMLFEIEKQYHGDEYELSIGLINDKQFGRTNLTTNMILKYAFGHVNKNDLEGEFRMQYRYRLRPTFQPALEIYSDRNFFGIGPGFMGIKKFSPMRHLKWELAFIKGINGDSKDHTLRVGIEMTF